MEREMRKTYKKRYAVIDNYHEGAFPVVAVCKTQRAAEGYKARRTKADKEKGNNHNYDIIEIMTGIIWK